MNSRWCILTVPVYHINDAVSICSVVHCLLQLFLFVVDVVSQMMSMQFINSQCSVFSMLSCYSVTTYVSESRILLTFSAILLLMCCRRTAVILSNQILRCFVKFWGISEIQLCTDHVFSVRLPSIFEWILDTGYRLTSTLRTILNRALYIIWFCLS